MTFGRGIKSCKSEAAMVTAGTKVNAAAAPVRVVMVLLNRIFSLVSYLLGFDSLLLLYPDAGSF